MLRFTLHWVFRCLLAKTVDNFAQKEDYSHNRRLSEAKYLCSNNTVRGVINNEIPFQIFYSMSLQNIDLSSWAPFIPRIIIHPIFEEVY